jgi:hypothetical protein
VLPYPDVVEGLKEGSDVPRRIEGADLDDPT